MSEASQQLSGVVLWYNRILGEGRVQADCGEEYVIRNPVKFADGAKFHIVAGDRVRFRVEQEKFWKVFDLKLLNRAPTMEHGNAT